MKTLCRKYLNMLRQSFRKWNWRRKHIKQFRSVIFGKKKRILMSENDHLRLAKALAHQKKERRIKSALLAKFRFILKRADIHAFRQVPHDVITMNSEIDLLTRKGKIVNLKLVYPDEAVKAQGRVSIFSWIGMCLIGKKEGDRVRRNLYVHKIIYQPEANDDFHL